MDAHDRAMLQFAQRWSPYGGGDEQIFTEFGVSIPTFYRRVLTLVESRTTDLNYATKQVLRTFCAVKLSQHDDFAWIDLHKPQEPRRMRGRQEPRPTMNTVEVPTPPPATTAATAINSARRRPDQFTPEPTTAG